MFVFLWFLYRTVAQKHHHAHTKRATYETRLICAQKVIFEHLIANVLKLIELVLIANRVGNE